MKIEYRDGLLFTEITVHFNEKKKVINNIVIDTGASHTLDFTTFKYHNINGLLGLDILVKGKFNVDLDNFRLHHSFVT